MRVLAILCCIVYSAAAVNVDISARHEGDEQRHALEQNNQPPPAYPTPPAYGPSTPTAKEHKTHTALESHTHTTHSHTTTHAPPPYTPTPWPSCSAEEDKDPKDCNCNIWGGVVHPHDGFLLPDVSLKSCKDACVCGDSKYECKAFAWESLKEHDGLGNCTLYDEKLKKMEFYEEKKKRGGSHLWDRDCFHRHHHQPHTMTMGSYELKHRKRGGLDSYLMEALFKGGNA